MMTYQMRIKKLIKENTSESNINKYSKDNKYKHGKNVLDIK